jgi:hypothetical protein
MNQVIERLKRQIKYHLDTGDYVGAKNQLDKLISFTEGDIIEEVL